jgi:hypothetical protein
MENVDNLPATRFRDDIQAHVQYEQEPQASFRLPVGVILPPPWKHITHPRSPHEPQNAPFSAGPRPPYEVQHLLEPEPGPSSPRLQYLEQDHSPMQMGYRGPRLAPISSERQYRNGDVLPSHRRLQPEASISARLGGLVLPPPSVDRQFEEGEILPSVESEVGEFLHAPIPPNVPTSGDLGNFSDERLQPGSMLPISELVNNSAAERGI